MAFSACVRGPNTRCRRKATAAEEWAPRACPSLLMVASRLPEGMARSVGSDPQAGGRVLVVDDDRHIVELVAYNLGREGFDVDVAHDGRTAIEKAHAAPPDLVILDLMLPYVDGLEVCRRLRGQGSVPILMLTAKDAEHDRVLGLESGADDYVTKPFSPRELVARVRAILRRARVRGGDRDAALVCGNLTSTRPRMKSILGAGSSTSRQKNSICCSC